MKGAATQLELQMPRAHHNVATSRTEAGRRQGKTHASLMRRVLLTIVAFGPLTRRELEDKLEERSGDICWAVDSLLPKRGNACLMENGSKRNGGKLLQINLLQRELVHRLVR